MNLIEHFQHQFAIPVLRETREESLYSLVEAITEGGLPIVEITLMSDSAYSVIKRLSSHSNMIVGAGTVTTLDEAKKAINSGAKFLVSPGLPIKAIEYAHTQNVPFYPGVLTPTEIITARDLGCELLKVFPISSVGGTSYLQNLKGPFPKLKWMATGGVKLADLKSYMDTGTTCVGIGNQLTPIEMINMKDWNGLTKEAQKFSDAVKDLRKH
jgi:2-dehydro-3-deoxyphosphogluconate aldolase/(4S)-4-hydroxy-2-oxoglutarate aldolase